MVGPRRCMELRRQFFCKGLPLFNLDLEILQWINYVTNFYDQVVVDWEKIPKKSRFYN